MDWGPWMFRINCHTSNPILRFENCEDGAVTVDWVVLSATIVLFGAVMIGIYKDGVFNLSSSISDAVVESAPTAEDTAWK